MLDAFIIERLKEEERRRENRRPQLRLPVYIDEDCEMDRRRREDPQEKKDEETTTLVIDYS
jgi:hypothetical protein